MPVQSSFDSPPIQMLATHDRTTLSDLAANAGYTTGCCISANAAGTSAAETGAGAASAAQQRLRQRRRVPLPREAVSELRAMLKTERYPQPEAREALARRHGLERKRVDRRPIVGSVAHCQLSRSIIDVGPLRQHT